MRTYRAVALISSIVACLGGLTPPAAAEPPTADRPASVERPRHVDSVALFGPPHFVALETPNGVCYVRLVGEIDGPVRIPVAEESGLKALQLTADRRPGGTVEIVLSAVHDELVITPVGSYELAGAEAEVLELPELSAYGLTDWRMSLATIRDQAADGCCTCGSLTCCPFTGKCLECGDCGSCCNSGGAIPK